MMRADAGSSTWQPGLPGVQEVRHPPDAGSAGLRVAVINAGGQTDYLYGLVSGLASVPALQIDVVDSDNARGLFDAHRSVRFFNLRGDQNPRSPFFVKIGRVLRYYYRLVKWAATTDAELFHIQWDNKFALLDRTVLLLYYKALGKRLVYTAHNVNAKTRAGQSDPITDLSLRCLYALVDHIIVHTEPMREELVHRYRVPRAKVSVVRHGINNRVAVRGRSRAEARAALGIDPARKVLLFFGKIERYKGLDVLMTSLRTLVSRDPSYLLLIAGRPAGPAQEMDEIKRAASDGLQSHTAMHLDFVPDQDVETYFMAADCLVLPYRGIFQSGVLFLAYRFGLPVVATDVGSFPNEIVEGETGLLCRREDPDHLAAQIAAYYRSGLYADLDESRRRIKRHANERYGWEGIGRETSEIYRRIAGAAPAPHPPST
jgi:glycosyltransferase involved in cell wall biosynthesis